MSETGEDYYDSRTLEASEGWIRYYQWLLEHVGHLVRGRALEIGAGIGTLSRRIAPLCTEIVLVEPARNLCQVLTGKMAAVDNAHVSQGTLDEAVRNDPELFAPGFDTIISFNVLEHIPDDVGVLRQAGRLLRADGRLVLFVPATPFLYGALDAQVNHVRRYTKKTLTRALAEAGLTVTSLHYFDFLGMFPWLLMGRVLRRTTGGGGVESYDRFVVPVCRVFDRLIGPPVGKNLIAVAQRAN